MWLFRWGSAGETKGGGIYGSYFPHTKDWKENVIAVVGKSNIMVFEI